MPIYKQEKSLLDNDGLPTYTARFGAVWEGSTENQRMSENAIFGHYTPCAEFVATIKNQAAADQLVVGKQYYFDIHEA